MNQAAESAHDTLKERARTLPGQPGVYRFLDRRGQILYVGKARNLKKRVSSYFNRNSGTGVKQRAMLEHVTGLEFTVTHTEGEALLLESNLIKEYRPRYNIVLRDDKSYPYIYLAADHAFPRLAFHRGARTGPGRYFGPFPSAGAVRQTLNLLQKLFRVRQCEDSFYRNRSRPCLQYQIERCGAPCVDLISAADYAEDVRHAVMFLEGRSQAVIEVLVRNMEQAAREHAYERAARLRDQIYDLRRVQQNQNVTLDGGEFDIATGLIIAGVGCVQITVVRGGRNLGNKTFYPAHTRDSEPQEMLAAFLAQYYLAPRPDRQIPPDIIVSHDFADRELLAEVLQQHGGRVVRIRVNVRGERRRLLDMAATNTELMLRQRLASDTDYRQRLDALRELLELSDDIERIECFDISHTRGERPVASCVVFDREGARNSDYRRFNIAGIEPGDDYAAMRQAVERRYTRIKSDEGVLPDVLLIDGGKGQVQAALNALEAVQVNGPCVVGVAKGPARKAGQETLILHDKSSARRLPANSPALHVVQQIRDEAHRFAITGHRQQRAKQRRRSPLEEVAGIGSKRRQQLIKHFGGLQGVARAGIDDLAKVAGISHALAGRIYNAFHDNE